MDLEKGGQHVEDATQKFKAYNKRIRIQRDVLIFCMLLSLVSGLENWWLAAIAIGFCIFNVVDDVRMKSTCK